ncbi:pyruvate, phosphate dikinase [Heliophilum fasciatum]|uniref:Pyruvate, phosphate dikinase n=1 Tax=Heliophilum fasciatum TaxID=35700 RepID=A0A4R2RK17_9FIRM|nr:pyruvate, phosphate dikinase [Heliophilum fasciatum]MCW2278153.1 pyruvate,orthophosphate dikinase [Heliophilum fasciatum]TCP64222.1 pyruvate phosphate dikinase [Heliophilum fasciatum]
MSKKWVYLFREGNAEMKSLLGGKGANLAEMTNIGLPVPPGLTITTEACNAYYACNLQYPEGMMEQVKAALADVEQACGKQFGDKENPLLVSVRSGAVFSMPGMMDTILNLGLNDETVQGLIKATGNERFALDCYRRFIQMYSDVVLGASHAEFERILEECREKQGVHFDNELTPASLQELIAAYKEMVQRTTGQMFPQDPMDQLEGAILAVFKSWNNDRANIYRELHKIPHDLGTAVNVQTMVFGNMGNDCGTGVAFTRNPSTGEKKLYGEYLINAQGEDVVAGIRTPQHISKLAEEMPVVFEQFTNICALLEKHYRNMQDIEFTIERGKLYMLQTRNGKRTAAAAVKCAVDMVEEGLITKSEAIMRVEPEHLDQLLHRRIDPSAKLKVIATGLPASPGAASGTVVFDADEADRQNKAGNKIILVRTETTPDDIHGIIAAQGVLTSRGGMTSHAAVVARQMGKPCVCGCEALRIDYAKEEFAALTTSGELIVVKAGDLVSIDGATGRVIDGEVPMLEPELTNEFQNLLTWADEFRTIGVRANADKPSEAEQARAFGAAGIGLTRTEHMFMAQERLPIVQEMILAQSVEEREVALAKLLPMQQEDFYGILKAMAGFPVCIRLLDPPLHEFLPNQEDLLVEVTKLRCQLTTCADSEKDAIWATLCENEEMLKKVRNLHEFNPMLGHRGCRLGITYPEIYRMQARAIFQAVAQLTQEGYQVEPEVEIPLVVHVNELAELRRLVDATAAAVMEETGVKFHYAVGTMIEVPRAALTADQIAKEAQFFSFGTNDLTQTSFGLSRDDAEGKFLGFYTENKIIKENPFIVLDREGVGQLMQMACAKGRSTRPDILLGICGEHGGEPSSIEFCHLIGLNFVSCSPFRVPIARLAAAQAAIRNAK